MRKAIQQCFPKASLMSCVRHLRTNTLDYLRDTVGCSNSTRAHVLQKIFGDGGLVESEDEVVFSIRQDSVEALIEEECARFKPYFTSQLAPKLKQNLQTVQHNNFVSSRWTNNNAESINHILKLLVDWRAQPLLDLVRKLHELVRVHYLDVQRAMVGEGNFILSPEFEKFCVQPAVWEKKSTEQRTRHLNRFLGTPKLLNSRSVMSTDGQLTLLKSGADGKKTQ